MTLALYRKYRPQGFEALIGQEAIKSTLTNALKKDKVSHAYLFTGPRGTGKTSSAKIFAKALNCLNPNGIDPCSNCDACKDNNPDIIEMDAASNNGVDEIRDLREKVSYAPVYGKYKVYIIDEVHMLTNQAFNALLKTLEEPPAHVVFILATTEPHKIPLTILSRCQRYDFRRIPEQEIVSRMEWIINEENADVQKEALQLIAQIAAGGMRDALSLLDQVISHADSQVTLQDVIELTGAVDTRKIGKLIHHIAKNDIEGSLDHFNFCFQSGQEPQFFIEEMMNYYRDILVFEKLGNKATLKKGLTDPAFESIALQVPTDSIYGHLNVLQEAMGKLKFHHDTQLLVEMSIVKMAQGFQQDGPTNHELKLLKEEVAELKKMVLSGTATEFVTATAASIDESTEEQPVLIQEELLNTVEEPIEEVTINVSLESIMETLPKAEVQDEEVTSVEIIESTTPALENGPDIFQDVQEDFIPAFEDENPIPGNFIELVSNAIENKEPWVDVVEEPNLPETTANDTHSTETTIEEIPSTVIVEEYQEEEVSAEEVLLTDEEEAVLALLNQCTKEYKKMFADKYETFMNMLKETNLSSNALCREFTIKGVSDSVILMSHPDAIKVKLISKVKNKAIIESCLSETYGKSIKLVPITNAEWERVLAEFRFRLHQ
ncbi:DNA polymerase III subunit gamma/tau [Viridibacillus arvi]|uniref:DNA polymerase III subunit gamma/tau n=1 Tax=Viridibacillus arvi TaxID=263475 RepID=UPI0034CFEB68